MGLTVRWGRLFCIGEIIMILAGMQQTVMDQGPSWTEIVTCLAVAIGAVSPIIILWFKRRNKKS